MENNTLQKTSLQDKFSNFIKSNKLKFLSLLAMIILLIIFGVFFQYFQNQKNDKISQKFIEAGIHLSNKDKERSKSIYKEIILSKNLFYSPLALNNIIDNELEDNSDEILNFFDVLEKTKMNRNQKYLLKLKKGLYLIKTSKIEEGEKILKEIIDDESPWSGIATEILKR